MQTWRVKYRSWLVSHWYLFAWCAVLLLLLVLHGTLPVVNAPNMLVQASFPGRAMCLEETGSFFKLTCARIGYPIGYRNIEGFPIVAGVALIHRLTGIGLVDAVQVFYSLFILVGGLSLSWWIWRMSGSLVAGLLSTLLYYGSVFLLAYTFLADLYPGLLLFPFFVVGGIVILDALKAALEHGDAPRLILVSIAQVAILEFAVLVSGYVYVIAVLTLGIWCLVAAVTASRESRKHIPGHVGLLVLFGVLLVAPGLIYQTLIFRAPTPASSLDLMRGQAVDLMTMFVPTQRWLLFAQLLHIGPPSWNGAAFYGTGQNSNFNYVGVITPLAGGAAVLMAALRKLRLRRAIITLGIVWLAGFVLSLGPSLKVADTRPAGASTSAYSLWEMAPEWATLAMPTEPLYRMPLINTMRYTYRWQLMSRFALAALLGLFIAQLYSRSKLLAAVLCLLATVESMPTAVLHAQQTPTFNRAYGEAFKAQVLIPLAPYVENQRVLFLPAANDYLIALIAPFTRTYSYNVSFDKEMRRIQPLQPRPITSAERAFSQGTLAPVDVCQLLKKNLVDRVVFTYFSLNKGWSRKAVDVAAYRRPVEALKLDDFPGLVTKEEQFFLVVSSDPLSGKCSP